MPNKPLTAADVSHLSELPVKDLLSALKSTENGLPTEEAKERLDRYGPNKIIERKKSQIWAFLSFFWGPIPWMIEAACLLSVLLARYEDLAIILALLLLNALVGFWQQFHASNAIDALKKTLAPIARVKRDGVWKTVLSEEIVPGDILRLRIGDIIPADAKLCDCDPIEVDQSTLTGESLPVTAKAGDTVFAGSVVLRGEIDAVAFATGSRTNFGHAIELVTDEMGTSHFQMEILRIGDFLLIVAGILAALLILVGIFRGEGFATNLQFGLILTIAAIPAAMPAVLTTTMALGARLLAQKSTVVTRLESIHELAGIDVLCCDKTGTLTQNSLRVVDVIAMKDVSEDSVLLCAQLSSREENRDPIDTAILYQKSPDLVHYNVTHFTPFDPIIKRTEATVVSEEKDVMSVSKGSVPLILALCDKSDSVQEFAETHEQALADKGLRALGVAKKTSGTWRFQGIIALSDPPRSDAQEILKQAHDMGITVKMITGDQLPIAREMARQLSIGTNILDAGMFEQMEHYRIGQLDDEIEHADGFAKAFPDHKYYIVESLQKRGHIVGMTGDGVNDAPALHKADAGIAVQGAVDAARSAADIVLLKPGLSVIIEAIKESRRIFQRMTSYTLYRIAETMRILLFITLSVLIMHFYPVTPIMIILLALFNDGAILSIAFDNADVGARPQKWNMRTILTVSTALGVIGVISSFLLFYIVARVYELPEPVIQTIVYLKLSVAGHFMIFHTRTRGSIFESQPAFILLFATIATQLVATVIAVYGLLMSPIGWKMAGIIWLYIAAWVPINEIVKRFAYRFSGNISAIKPVAIKLQNA